MLDDQTYWFHTEKSPAKDKSINARLLPNYDEYIVGYTDRKPIYDPVRNQHLDAHGNVLFQNTIVMDGHIAGTWKRTLKKNSVEIKLHPFQKMTRAETLAVTMATEQFGKFVELPVTLIQLGEYQ